MNTAFLDAQNLAWKIHLVESGFADRSLLQTYEFERKEVAETLLSFDNEYAKLFSQKPPSASAVAAANESESAPSAEAQSDNAFIQTFKESCEFTSGYGVKYQPSVITWSADHPAQSLTVHSAGNKVRPGRLLINADVTRVVDANVVHLEQEVPMNGSFRIFVFAGKASTTAKALSDFEQGLHKRNSFYAAYQRPDVATVSHHEKHNPHSLFYTFCIVFAGRRQDVEISRDVPGLLAQYRDHVYADDQWNRRVPDATAAAHAKMGFDQERGGVVVVRPDGYVGIVTSLVEGSGTLDALNAYFSSFCTKKLSQESAQL